VPSHSTRYTQFLIFLFTATTGDKQKFSIYNVRKPLNAFAEGESYRNVKKEVAGGKTLSLLQLRGPLGIGKKEIARKLAQEFPFANVQCAITHDQPIIKQEIDCSEGNAKLSEHLKNLLERLYKNHFVDDYTFFQSARSDLNINETKLFVQCLVQAAAPVIIIIHNPTKECRKILKNLGSWMAKADVQYPACVCISPDSFFQDTYKIHKVAGLTEEESIRFLLNPERNLESLPSSEKQAICTIKQRLQGSPFGLTVVKLHCQLSNVNYSDYLKRFPVGNVKGEEYMFKTVTDFLSSRNDLFDMLKSLENFHHNNIPIILIKKVLVKLQIDTDYSNPLKELLELNVCTTEGEGDMLKVTFHEILFLAVKNYMQFRNTEAIHHLKIAILAISSLATKDLRTKSNKQEMKSLRHHIRSALHHFEDIKGKYLEDKEFQLVTLAVSHLHEVFAAISNNSSHEQAHFQSSLAILCEDVTRRSNFKLETSRLLNKQTESIKELASSIIDACMAAGDALHDSGVDLIQYASLVIQMHRQDVGFLKKIVSSKELFAKLIELSQNHSGISAEVIKCLRMEGTKVFLDEDKHYQSFYVDRLVSVLHSVCRSWAFLHREGTKKPTENYVWIADLVKALCLDYKKKTGISLLTLSLNLSNTVNARLVKAPHLPEEMQKQNFKEANHLVEENLHFVTRSSDMLYENGMIKTDFETMLQELELEAL